MRSPRLRHDAAGVALAAGVARSATASSTASTSTSPPRGLEGLPAVPHLRAAALEGHRGHARPDQLRRVQVQRQDPDRGARRQPQRRRHPGRVRCHRRRDPHADGSVDTSYTAHYNDAGVALTTHAEPGGEPEPTRYSLLLENVSDATIDTYEHVTGPFARPRRRATVRLDFTPDDFATIQEQAFDQLQWHSSRTASTSARTSCATSWRSTPTAATRTGSTPSSTTPTSSPRRRRRSRPSTTLPRLRPRPRRRRRPEVALDFMMGTTAARHDIHDWPHRAPRQPAARHPVAPDCD